MSGETATSMPMGRCVVKPECGLARTFAVIDNEPTCVFDARSDDNCLPGETYFEPFDMCAFITDCDRTQYSLGEGCTDAFVRCNELSEDLIINEAYRLCTCPEDYHWNDENSTCVENAICDDFEFYHRRDNEPQLKPQCLHHQLFSYETYICEQDFDCKSVYYPWYTNDECVDFCDANTMVGNLTIMECFC